MSDRTSAPLKAALEAGRACAVARHSQQDLRDCADAHGELFAAKPFGSALYGSLALACAFGAPGLDAKQLRMANRSALWVFAVDWLIDAKAELSEQVEDLVRRSVAVVDGDAASDPLSRLLAEIRDELATAPQFEALRPVWADEVRRMLTSMSREWTWKDTGALPGFAEYLDNADNFGSCFVNVSHWISNDTFAPPLLIHEVLPASREVQRVLRLKNDLRTFDRDQSWGDLNALSLGVTRAEIDATCTTLVENCHRLFDVTAGAHPGPVEYLARQIGFSTGFYGDADYWGAA